MGSKHTRDMQRRAQAQGQIDEISPEERGKVAGNPLELPRFHPVDWEEMERFTVEDDPDRTAEVWELPSWIAEKDPTQQHGHIVVEPLEVPAECQEYNAEGFSFAKVLHNVLTPDQCQSLIQRINQKGFTPALLNIGRGNQMLCPETRDGHRAIVDSPTFAQYLLEAIRPHLQNSVQCEVQRGIWSG